MQADWAGQTTAITDTDTGEVIPAYLFIAVLPFSGYSYTKALPGIKTVFFYKSGSMSEKSESILTRSVQF